MLKSVHQCFPKPETPKDIQFTVPEDRNEKIFTLKKLKPLNLECYCLKIY